jgi:hypothetical protein
LCGVLAYASAEILVFLELAQTSLVSASRTALSLPEFPDGNRLTRTRAAGQDGIAGATIRVAPSIMRVSRMPAVLMTLTLVALAATSARAEGEGKMIPVGDPFVDFDLPAHDGTAVRSADLAGRPFLLFFYPKADTPG